MATGKLTEAQRIVEDLIERGMAGAAIAREIGVKADTIQNIKGRKATGNLQLHRLRILRDQMVSAADGGNTAQAADVPTAPVIDQLPPIADLFTPVQDGPEPSALTLNADEPAPAEPKSLKDRASDWLRAAMLGEPSTNPSSLPGMSAPSRSGGSKKSATGAEQGDLIEQLVPLAALLFVMTGSVLIPDPYKACGPRQDEATAIAYPIVKRAVRELDARKKLSEATTDAIAILLAVGAYGVRAHSTWQMIHAEEVQRARSNNQPPAGAAYVAASGGGPVNTAAAPADAATRHDGNGQSAPLPLWRGDKRLAREAARSEGHGGRREPATPEQRRADDSINALLAADHAGRQRLGL